MHNDDNEHDQVEVPYELTAQQKKFVKAAERAGFSVRYDYSGRFMYGRRCPAVYLDRYQQNDFGFKGASSDSLGLGRVIYYP